MHKAAPEGENLPGFLYGENGENVREAALPGQSPSPQRIRFSFESKEKQKTSIAPALVFFITLSLSSGRPDSLLAGFAKQTEKGGEDQ